MLGKISLNMKDPWVAEFPQFPLRTRRIKGRVGEGENRPDHPRESHVIGCELGCQRWEFKRGNSNSVERILYWKDWKGFKGRKKGDSADSAKYTTVFLWLSFCLLSYYFVTRSEYSACKEFTPLFHREISVLPLYCHFHLFQLSLTEFFMKGQL